MTLAHKFPSTWAREGHAGTAAKRGARCARVASIALSALLPSLLAVGADNPAHADDGKWTIRLEPMVVQPYGHDQHVLTIHEFDLDSTPAVDRKTAVNLETESGIAYRGGLEYKRGQWAWGADFFWFDTSQSVASRTAAAEGPGGTIDQVVFEIADRQFTSSDPGEVAFYRVLEDTDLTLWTLDLFALRTLAETPAATFGVQLGVRFGDFDNDYRAAVGIQDVIGARLDASSNYDLMVGPLVGLAGTVRSGRSRIEGYIGQSVLMGSAELTSASAQFTGPFGSPSYFDQREFKSLQDVAIPITELRIGWTYDVSKSLALGVGVNSSVWWNVPVPPGVVPVENGGEALHESTIVLFGLLGSVHLTF